MTDERVQYAMDYARTLPHYLPSDAEQALTVLAGEVERTTAELDRLSCAVGTPTHLTRLENP